MLAPVARRTAVDGAKHCVLDEPTGLLTDGVAVKSGKPAALGDGLISQDAATNNLVVMLQRIGTPRGKLPTCRIPRGTEYESRKPAGSPYRFDGPWHSPA